MLHLTDEKVPNNLAALPTPGCDEEIHGQIFFFSVRGFSAESKIKNYHPLRSRARERAWLLPLMLVKKTDVSLGMPVNQTSIKEGLP